MIRLVGKIMAVVILACNLANTVFCQSCKIPSYKVYPATAPIVIDGKIDDAAWAKADLINNFVVNSDNSPSPYKTEAKILYDNEYIYFAFRSFDENIWSVKSKRDEHLWEEEVVEVFICANPNASNYIEIEINPVGALLDAYMLDSIKCLPYDSWNMKNLKWAVDVQGNVDGEPGDTAWTCEIAFPIIDAVTAQNIPPKPGDVWYINLYRAELKPKYVLISWSPTFKDDFHIPSCFGKLIFAGSKE